LRYKIHEIKFRVLAKQSSIEQYINLLVVFTAFVTLQSSCCSQRWTTGLPVAITLNQAHLSPPSLHRRHLHWSLPCSIWEFLPMEPNTEATCDESIKIW
jgi:hypothetical protein